MTTAATRVRVQQSMRNDEAWLILRPEAGLVQGGDYKWTADTAQAARYASRACAENAARFDGLEVIE